MDAGFEINSVLPTKNQCSSASFRESLPTKYELSSPPVTKIPSSPISISDSVLPTPPSKTRVPASPELRSVLPTPPIEKNYKRIPCSKMETPKEPNQKLKFVYINASSANNKMDLIRNFTQQIHDAKILFMTETWFNDTSRLKIDNFNLLTKQNRTSNKKSWSQGRGGGCAIYVHQSISHECYPIDLKTKSRLCQNVAAVICGQTFVLSYRSPSMTEDLAIQTCSNDWSNLNPGDDNFIWLGDFNLADKCDFDEDIVINNKYSPLFNAITSHGKDQLVEDKTHVRGNKLDLIFANTDNNLTSIEIQDKFESLDHLPIVGELLVHVPKTNLDYYVEVFDVKNGDMKGFRKELESVDWNFIENKPSIDAMIETFGDTLIKAFKNHVPIRRIYPRKDKSTGYAKDTIAQIEKAKNLKQKGNRRAFIIQMNKANRLIKRDNAKKQEKLLRQMSRNKDAIYRAVDETNEHSEFDTIGPLIKNEKGDLTKSTEEVLEVMKEFLRGVFGTKTAPNVDWDDDSDLQDKPKIKRIKFTERKVFWSIQKLKTSTATGPDKITATMLRESRWVISKTLSNMFNRIMNSGICPKIWKLSRIKLLKKPGLRTLPTNHRPIAVGSILEKVFSRIVIFEIVSFLEVNDLLDRRQFGFRPGVQLVENLIEFEEFVVNELDKKNDVTAVYLDVRKCFDCVPHGRLLEDIKEFGITGQIGKYWENYYQCYQQYVQIEDQCSQPFQVSSGVIQGSVAGPIHFLLFYNTMFQCCQNSLVLGYADDLKVARVTNCCDDFILLEKDLAALQEKMTEKGLEFNVKKTLAVYFGKNNLKIRMRLGGEKIEEAETIRDLGAYYGFHRKYLLNKRPHYDRIIGTMNRKIGIIKKNFKNVNFKSYCFLWNTYVLPHYFFAHQFYLNVGDTVMMSELNKCYRRFFYDVIIPINEAHLVPENPVRKILIAGDLFFQEFVMGAHHLNPNLIQKSNSNARLGEKFGIITKPARTDAKLYSFLNSRSKLWNQQSRETQLSTEKYHQTSALNIDQKYPLLLQTTTEIQEGKLSQHTAILKSRIAASRRRSPAK